MGVMNILMNGVHVNRENEEREKRKKRKKKNREEELRPRTLPTKNAIAGR